MENHQVIAVVKYTPR